MAQVIQANQQLERNVSVIKVACPFCTIENDIEINSELADKLLYIHPIGTFNVVTPELPNDKGIFIKDIYVKCQNKSHNHYFIITILNKAKESKRYHKYFLDMLLIDDCAIISKKLFFESLFDTILKFFYSIILFIRNLSNRSIEYRFNISEYRSRNRYGNRRIRFIDSIIFNLIVTFILVGIPSIISNNYQDINWSLFVLFLFNTLITYLLISLVKSIRKSIDNDEIPLKLSNEYRKTNSYKVLKEQIKGGIFGYPLKMNINSYLLGFCLLILYLTQLVSYPNRPYLFMYPENIQIIGNLLFVYTTFYIVGNSILFSFKTMIQLGMIAQNIPLKINPLKKAGGIDLLGTYYSSALSQICLIIFGFLSLFIYENMNPSLLNIIVDQMSKIPLFILIPLIYVIMFSYLAFFYPVWIMHKKLKMTKDSLLDIIINKMSVKSIVGKSNDVNDEIHKLTLFKTYEKVQSMDEWPFESNAISIIKNFLVYFLLPLIATLITLYQLIITLK